MSQHDSKKIKKPRFLAQRAGLLQLLLLGLFLYPSPLTATPLWEVSGDQSTPQVLSGRHTAQGPGSVYSNPAKLIGQQKDLRIGFFSFSGRLTVDYAERQDVDIPGSIYDARVEDPQGRRVPPATRPLPTADLPSGRGSQDPSFLTHYLSFGALFPFFDDRLAMGVLATLSLDRFAYQAPFFVDEREQYFSNSLHFELLGDRLVGSSIAAAGAVALRENLSLGIGLVMSQQALAENQIFSPDALDQERSEVNSGVTVTTGFVPHGAISFQPHWRVELSATYHHEFANPVRGESELRFWNFPAYPEGEDSVRQELVQVYDFLPIRGSLGALFHLFSREEGATRDLSFGADVQYARWSTYLNRQGETGTFQDTFAPTVSAQLRDENYIAALNLQFQPTFVPPQEGRTNYVDNHRIALASGYERTFSFAEQSFRAGLQGQVHYLLPRSVEKNLQATDPVIDEFPEATHRQTGETIEASLDFRTNNPGYPGFGSKGWLFGIGLSISSSF